MNAKTSESDIAALMTRIGAAAREAARMLRDADGALRNRALMVAAQVLEERQADVLAANATDMATARERGLSKALLDRLALDEARVGAMVRGIREIVELPDPIGTVTAEWERPNGLRIQRVRVPLGVIGIIYESRPNVTADAGALCLKSANVAILRGGSESHHSSRAIHACLVAGLEAVGLPPASIQIVPTVERSAVGYMLSSMSDYIDVIVPRGGKSLIARVQQDARVPVIGHLEGNCHVYVDRSADLEMARAIVLNAKLRRTGICGAAETVLIDEAAVATHAGPVLQALLDAGCEVRADAMLQDLDSRLVPATEDDWYTEYLDAVIAARVVGGVEGAIDHIERYGSAHTEAIVATDQAAAERFLAGVDSAIVLHNASTQFADGGEFGMGAEIGISTDKFHARGPVGVEQLTSYKYVVRGQGQTRP
ncbi:MAG TPA: glutamate-5-semialdehyde dehydrogenase [Steroidobacteraceae bacterium]|nr:glutamate-5-semialdehyde dehydrogenase [Steroidobacteraceae bacterium]